MTTTVTPHGSVIPAAPRTGRLPLREDERRRILALREEGYTIRDVAAMIGRSETTVGRVSPGRGQSVARARCVGQAPSVHAAPPSDVKQCSRCLHLRPFALFPQAKRRVCLYCLDLNPIIPVYPLLPVLTKFQARHEWDHTTLANIIGIDERTWSFWRHHARDPRLSVVEDILDRLDVLWFDVYNEETVRYAVRIIEQRRPRRRMIDGVMRDYYEVVSRERVGDLGPNLAELARIERAFRGPDVADVDDLEAYDFGVAA